MHAWLVRRVFGGRMLRSLLLGVGFAGALGIGTSALAETPRQPTGKWTLDYGTTQCTALRDYGAANDPFTFAIVPAPEGDTYELLLGLNRRPPVSAEELEATVDFGFGPIKSWFLKYASENRKLTVYQFRISASEMARARTASSIALHVKGDLDSNLELDTIPALLDGLEKCTADLKNYWNMDGEKDGRITTSAKGELHHLFTADDYPSEALNHLQEGGSQFLLLVDEKGTVAGCHVMIPSGSPVLDAMGCAVFRERAHFKPALDRAGKPVRSTYITPKVDWRMY